MRDISTALNITPGNFSKIGVLIMRKTTANQLTSKNYKIYTLFMLHF